MGADQGVFCCIVPRADWLAIRLIPSFGADGGSRLDIAKATQCSMISDGTSPIECWVRVGASMLTQSYTPKPNQMFAADPDVYDAGRAILARPASDVRAGEEREVAKALAALGSQSCAASAERGTLKGQMRCGFRPKRCIVGAWNAYQRRRGASNSLLYWAKWALEVIDVDMPVGTCI